MPEVFMKIEKIEAIPFSIPYSKPLKYGLKGYLKSADHVLVRVITSDGVIGLGEAMPRPIIYGESQTSIIWAVEQWIAPKLKGLPVYSVEKIWDQMKYLIANETAKGAVDLAIHEALAKSLGMPLYQLLGGWTNKIPVAWIVGQMDTDEMVRECLDVQEKGINSFKVKVGIEPKKDVDVIGRLRQELGDEALIYVDANQAFSYQEAIRFIPMLENLGINMVEEPIPVSNSRGRLRLAQQISVPFIGDESVISPLHVRNEINLGAVSVISIKTPRTGYYQSRKIVHLAEQADLSCIIGTQVETDIGVLAAAHFGAAFKIFSYPAEITYFLTMKDQLLASQLKIENGTLLLPEAPGLGIELDEDKLRRYRQDKEPVD
jgi:L-alanine-DL-glutamate epimerase-like enolase superfamily enzyme